MLYNSLKNIVKKFPLLWAFLRKFKDLLIILSRLKDVFMMMVLFHIWPEQTYRFSTRRLLPGKKNRFSKNFKPVMPYELFKSKSSKISVMKEINLIGVSPNFDLNNLKKMNGPIFLVSFWTPIHINENGKVIYKNPNAWEEEYCEDYLDVYWKKGKKHWYKNSSDENKKNSYSNNKINSKTLDDFKKKNITYVISRLECLEPFKKNNYNTCAIPIYIKDEDGNFLPRNEIWEKSNFLDLFDNDSCNKISLVEKVYKPPLEAEYFWPPTGSFLPALCALSHVAEKINVYGWDFYLDNSPKNMNYWQLFLNMYKFLPDLSRSKNHFESALINFYYGYQLSKLPHINIHGHMGQLQNHTKLIERIEKVLFN